MCNTAFPDFLCPVALKLPENVFKLWGNLPNGYIYDGKMKKAALFCFSYLFAEESQNINEIIVFLSKLGGHKWSD